MAKLVLHADDDGFTGTVVFKDKHGNVRLPASPPVWTASVDGIVSLTPSADGMSIDGTLTGEAGDLTIDVVAEGDSVPGVDTVHLSSDLSVLPSEISTGELTLTAKP